MRLPILECKRCLHKWVPRTPQEPKVCPKCKSAYWDKPRTNSPELQKMNDTEKRAYKWLTARFPNETIQFSHSTSPDFITGGGKGYEVKKYACHKIHLPESQWLNLSTVDDCYILVFNEGVEPLEIIPLKGKTPPFSHGDFLIDVIPDALANYKRHLEILAQVSGRGFSGNQFWQEYRRIQSGGRPDDKSDGGSSSEQPPR